jgi:hypothetical protein
MHQDNSTEPRQRGVHVHAPEPCAGGSIKRGDPDAECQRRTQTGVPRFVLSRPATRTSRMLPSVIGSVGWSKRAISAADLHRGDFEDCVPDVERLY